MRPFKSVFSIAVLNPEFLQLPVQAIECSLASLSAQHKKANKFVDKFLDLVDGKELVGRMDERGNDGKYLVLLIDTGGGATVNINEEMVAFSTEDGKQNAEKGVFVRKPFSRCVTFLLNAPETNTDMFTPVIHKLKNNAIHFPESASYRQYFGKFIFVNQNTP